METRLRMQGSIACSKQGKTSQGAHLDSVEVADELVH